MQTTTLNRGWLIKMGIYFVALVGLGIWGVVDGVWVYPARGRAAAEFLEKEYLSQAQKSGKLLNASVADPGAELRRLDGQERTLQREAEKAAAEGRAMAAEEMRTDLARFAWLEALSRVGEVTPKRTTFEDPVRRLADLEQSWSNKTPPKPLSAFDIPAQWVIAAVGLGAGGWLAFLFVKVSSRKYRYEPEAMRLTLPDGKSITPADIKEVDKRKWDKYFVFLHLKDGSPEVRLDLLRYTPLEQWILEMEKHVDGYVPPKAEEPAPAPAPTEPAPAEQPAKP